MFSYIKGELVEVNTDHIVVEVGGIGYMLSISGQAMSELPPVGTDIKVHTYLYIREDILMLYGFLDKDEMEVAPLDMTSEIASVVSSMLKSSNSFSFLLQ